MSKSIPVTCDPDGRLERLTELPRAFQGELKTLNGERYRKLKGSIERHGFFSPVFVWQDKEGMTWTLDGHQRCFVIENEKWTVEGGIPVVRIIADSPRDAAEKVILLSSTFGKIDEQGLYEFTETFGLPLPGWDLHDLPDFNFERFKEGFYDQSAANPNGDPNLPKQYAVVIECESEDTQAVVLGELMEKGYECRALIL